METVYFLSVTLIVTIMYLPARKIIKELKTIWRDR